MKYSLVIFLILALSLPGCRETPQAPEKTGSSVKWESFNSGLPKAMREKKPVFIDFYADWCHWCKVMDRETFSNEDVVKILNNDFVAVRIDMEKNESITYMGRTTSPNIFASMLGIQGLPTVAFMDKEGKLIDKVPGYIKPDIFTGILRYISEGCYKLQVTFTDYMNKKADCK